jgi:hypothetical protein
VPVELALLVAAANGATKFAKEVAPLVQQIQSGMLARNEKAKQQLLERIEALQGDLQKVGDLTQVLGAYFRTHENIVKLDAMCDRALRFVRDTAELRDRHESGSEGAWRVLDEMIGAIDENRDTAKQVSLNVDDWYSEADAVQIPTLLNQFTSAFDRANENLRARTVSRVLQHQGSNRPR